MYVKKEKKRKKKKKKAIGIERKRKDHPMGKMEDSGPDRIFSVLLFFFYFSCFRLSTSRCLVINDGSLLQNREGGDRSRSGGGGDFQRSDSSPGSRPSSVLPDLLTSSPGQRQDKSTSEEVRSTRPSVHLCSLLPPHRFVRALAYNCYYDYLDERERGYARWQSMRRRCVFPFLFIENMKLLSSIRSCEF